MKSKLKLSKPNGQVLMLCLFLLSLTLCATKSWSQLTKKTDSNCLCGSQIEIDSTIKILNDYPDLLAESNLLKRALTNIKTLNANQQAAILKVLNLEVWNERKVIWRIRWYKFGRPILSALGGVGVGVLIVTIK